MVEPRECPNCDEGELYQNKDGSWDCSWCYWHEKGDKE